MLCAAQGFSKKYELGAGGHINIHSVSGDVKITGYDGSAVLVTATKEGRDRDPGQRSGSHLEGMPQTHNDLGVVQVPADLAGQRAQQRQVLLEDALDGAPVVCEPPDAVRRFDRG